MLTYLVLQIKVLCVDPGHRATKLSLETEVYKLSSGGARQILRLISTGGTQSR